jgi:hypothetical protein
MYFIFRRDSLLVKNLRKETNLILALVKEGPNFAILGNLIFLFYNFQIIDSKVIG